MLKAPLKGAFFIHLGPKNLFMKHLKVFVVLLVCLVTTLNFSQEKFTLSGTISDSRKQ